MPRRVTLKFNFRPDVVRLLLDGQPPPLPLLWRWIDETYGYTVPVVRLVTDGGVKLTLSRKSRLLPVVCDADAWDVWPVFHRAS